MDDRSVYNSITREKEREREKSLSGFQLDGCTSSPEDVISLLPLSGEYLLRLEFPELPRANVGGKANNARITSGQYKYYREHPYPGFPIAASYVRLKILACSMPFGLSLLTGALVRYSSYYLITRRSCNKHLSIHLSPACLSTVRSISRLHPLARKYWNKCRSGKQAQCPTKSMTPHIFCEQPRKRPRRPFRRNRLHR